MSTVRFGRCKGSYKGGILAHIGLCEASRAPKWAYSPVRGCLVSRSRLLCSGSDSYGGSPWNCVCAGSVFLSGPQTLYRAFCSRETTVVERLRQRGRIAKKRTEMCSVGDSTPCTTTAALQYTLLRTPCSLQRLNTKYKAHSFPSARIMHSRPCRHTSAIRMC